MKIKTIYSVFKGYFTYLYYRHKFAKIDYFDYKKLITMPDIILPSPYLFNLSYGLFLPIKKIYKGKVDMFHDYIEHGLFYSETATLLEYILDRKPINRIFTFSERRKKQLQNILAKRKLKLDVQAMGPIIPYADNFHSPTELVNIKTRLGRTLLVIPMHSWTGVNNEFKHDEFVEEIERIKSDFDSVLVCLYYMDIRKGKQAYYENKGYTVVTNGDRLDPCFISRHKDLIQLADLTMSNGIGTHIGYSISLGKPHYYFKQEMRVELEKNVKKDEEQEQLYRVELEKKIVKLFGNYSCEITQDQKDFVTKYWGEF